MNYKITVKTRLTVWYYIISVILWLRLPVPRLIRSKTLVSIWSDNGKERIYSSVKYHEINS